MISKIELILCHSRQDRMYGSRILILGSMKQLWYMRNAENPTPTWLGFQQLDSASGETATSKKPRQSEENSNSTDPQLTTGLPEIPQEPPVLHPAVPSSQATSTVDAIPTVPPALQNKDSTPKAPRTPRAPRTSSEITKGIPPTRLGLPEH